MVKNVIQLNAKIKRAGDFNVNYMISDKNKGIMLCSVIF
jgi:hypothetical protein